jgi:hypothetical protein
MKSRPLIGVLCLCVGLIVMIAIAAGAGAANTHRIARALPAMPRPSAAALRKLRHRVAARRARLRSPAAARRRSRSRTAYRRVADGEALGIARGHFADVIDEPVYAGLRLRAGERVADYVSDNVALIDVAGSSRQSVARSTLPLRTEAPDGKKVPVDLGLRRHGSRLEPKAPIAGASFSDDAATGFTLADAGVTVRPDVAAGTAASVVEDKLFFANVATDTDLIELAVRAGAETFTVLRSDASPEDFGFTLDLPRGAELRLVPGANGLPAGAQVVRGGKVLVEIPTAHARDADGLDVPVAYRVEGDRLVLHVPHRGANFRYPLLVDPTLVSEPTYIRNGTETGTGWTDWHSGSTTTAYTPYIGYAPFPTYGTKYGLSIKSQGQVPGGGFANWYWASPLKTYIYRADWRFVTYEWAFSGGWTYQIVNEGITRNGVWETTGTQPNPHQLAGNYNNNYYNFCYRSPTVCDQIPDGARNGELDGNVMNFAMGNQFPTATFPTTYVSMQGADMYSNETYPPQVNSLTPNTGSAWHDTDLTSTSATYAAHDDGFGVWKYSVRSVAGTDEHTLNCTGQLNSLCPHDPSGSTVSYPLSWFSEGITTMDFWLTDAVNNISKHEPWTVKIDRSAPSANEFGGALAPGANWVKGGAHELKFKATDASAGVSQASVTLTGSTFGRDEFNRTTANGWGTALSGQTWLPFAGSDSTFSVDGMQAKLDLPPSAESSRKLGSESARDVDVKVQVNFPATGLTGEVIASLGARVAGSARYSVQLIKDATGKILLRTVNGTGTQIGATPVDTGLRYTPGTQYWLRAQLSGASPTSIKARSWPAGSTEPQTWAFDRTDSTIGPQQAGGLLLGGQQSGSVAPLKLGLDDYTASDLGPRRYVQLDNHCSTNPGCPKSSPVSFSWDASNELEGPHVFTASVTDPFATNEPTHPTHAFTRPGWTVKVDRTLPDDITLSGDLYDARGQTLTEDHIYTLDMEATDSPSGVASVAVDLQRDGATPIRVFFDSQPAAPDGTGMNRTWSGRLADYGPGHYTVIVTATDKASNPRPKSFDVTVPTPPSNGGVPVVSGTATDAETLTSTTGTWSGEGPIRYSYQWQRCDAQGANCADLEGELEPTISLRSQDVGTRIRSKVTAGNGGGASVAFSAPSPVVAALPPTLEDLPEAVGEPTIGITLTAMNGLWEGSSPMTYQYQWLRCNPLLPLPASCNEIAGGTAAEYTVTANDGGQALRVRVTATNAAGSAFAATADSDPTDPVGSFEAAPGGETVTEPPEPTAAEDLADAQRFRTENGLNADPAYISGLDAQPALDQSRELYGVSLTRYEQRGIELQDAITDQTSVIATYGETTAPAAYGGYYVDPAAGGLIYVGFTTNPAGHLAALRGVFPYPEHLRAFLATYTQQSLIAVQEQVDDDGGSGVLATAGVGWLGSDLDEEANKVTVAVSNPSPTVEGTLTARYGPAVKMEAGEETDLMGTTRTSTQYPKGGLVIYPVPYAGFDRTCTLSWLGHAFSFSSLQQAPALLTAGHCSESYGHFETAPGGGKAPVPTLHNPEEWHQGRRRYGNTRAPTIYNSDRPGEDRTVELRNGKYVRSDAVTIALASRFDPKPRLYISKKQAVTVHDVQRSNSEDGKKTRMCASLGRTNKKRCGTVRKTRVTLPAEAGHPQVRGARLLSFGCKKHDSGSPIFRYIKHRGATKAKAFGVLFAGQRRSSRCYYASMDNIRLDTTFRPSLG